MNKKFADGEVFQRLLKTVDALVLFAGGLTITLRSFDRFDAATPSASGFFVLFLGFLCLYVLRGLGLYQFESLANGIVTAIKSWVVTAIIGISLFKLSSHINLNLNSSWINAWLVSTALYFFITRGSLIRLLARVGRRAAGKCRFVPDHA